MIIYFLKENEYLLVESFTRRWTLMGPGRFYISPLIRVRRRTGKLLGPTHYLRVRNSLTGAVRNEVGPKLFFPAAYDEIKEELSAIPLKNGQYIRLLDQQTGAIRVVRGETSVVLSPTEVVAPPNFREAAENRIRALTALAEASGRSSHSHSAPPARHNTADLQVDTGGPLDGINIDEETAVLVRDVETGQLRLVTDPQVFIPAANEEIADIRQRIRLEDHQTIVIKDQEGRYIFRRGSDAERSFFLQPYQEIVQLNWSTGLHKDTRALKVSALDVRPKYMWYEFNARTQDNVELVLNITFFWQIVDVEAMFKATDDAPGDICSHARSRIIQAVAPQTLERFLASFNDIIREAVFGSEDRFYSERGVRLSAVEVRAISCKDPQTEHILQEIIQETTNRLNRLQKQESENEVQVRHIEGDIAAEERKGRLLELQREHALAQAATQGQAEAGRVRAYLDSLGDSLPVEDKLVVFNTLRKQDMLDALSQGTAQIYFTPADVNLSIESKNSGANGRDA